MPTGGESFEDTQIAPDEALEDSRDQALERQLRAMRPSAPARAKPLLDGVKLLDGRIEVLRKLGSGAVGTVYEVKDAGALIALKMLNNCTAEHLYRMKREFRSLAGVVHPNVVAVYELLAEDDLWFFTMERVRGIPLDRHWALQRSHAVDAQDFTARELNALRNLLRQTADGVCAIHDAGLLHRDLKPNNILVEPSGRVVILDFGLVSDQLTGGVGQTIAHQIMGTPAYMAPEQAVGLPAGPASDWYAVGVILYQLLTGQLPHSGTLLELLSAKQSATPLRPRALVPSIPEDLDELCCALLQHDPAQRPSTEAMRALVRSFAAVEPVRMSAPPAAFSGDAFVGRERELQQLSELFAEQSRPVFALVTGDSGMGKSELLRAFAGSLQRRHEPFILRGRCYEHEAVPYKALDEVIDGLTRILVRLSDEQAARLVPRHAYALTQLFPVLQRVSAFRAAAQPVASAELQRRLGSQALRELFARVADQRPLVLLIDDMQWSDVDSLNLLTELLTATDLHKLFILGSCLRHQEPAALTQLMTQSELRSTRIELTALPDAEAFKLALSLLPNSADTRAHAERIVIEAGGNPLYVLQLAAAGEQPESSSEHSLEQLLQKRILALPEEARTALELVGLASRPLPRNVLLRAIGEVAFPLAVAALRGTKLVHRFGAPPHEETFEPYHNRVRVAALALLDDTRRAELHDRLAKALQVVDNAEPEWLAQHLLGAGRNEEAYRHVLQAARKASSALAFHRAADLFALASDLIGADRAGHLLQEYGDALACAGRGVDAAEAYLKAGREATPERAIWLEGLAASQLLRHGHIADAVAVLKRVLARNGIAWPETVTEAMARFIYNRARIRLSLSLSRLKFRLREESAVPRDLLNKLDALYPAQTALGSYDYVRGACFASMALPLALQAGEPKRLVTALASEAIYSVMLDGRDGLARSRRLQASIESLAASMKDGYGAAVAELTSSLCAYWSGHWTRVRGPAQRAEQAFSERVLDGTWESALVRSVRHTVEIHAGGLAELAQEVPSDLLDATARNDRYAQLDLMRSMIAIHLRDDRVADAQALLGELHGLLSSHPVAAFNHLVMAIDVSFELYVGQLERAQLRLEMFWAACQRSGLQRLPLLRLNHLGMRADCALAARDGPPHKRAKTLSHLAKEATLQPVGWAGALAKQLEGESLILRRQPERGFEMLEEACELYNASGMLLSVACVRASQAEVSSGRRAAQLADEAQSFFQRQGIVRPECWRRLAHSVY